MPLFYASDMVNERIRESAAMDSFEQGSSISLSHVVVIVASLVLTLTAWQFSKSQIENRAEARFETEVENTIELLQDRMERYEDALWSGVAAINAQGGEISHAQWRTFAERLRLREKYPGINGIGVIRFVPADTLAAFDALQDTQQPGFQTRPPHDFPIAMPITYIEPLSINRAALGLDVAHETNRRQAALESRDTGAARITGPIVLVQDRNETPGFLFYAPLYDGNPTNPQERRDSAIGAVYAPFIVNKLMAGLLSKDSRDLRLSIRDADTVLYDEFGDPDAQTDPDPMFQRSITIELYGRSWELDMATTQSFRAKNSYVQPNVILIGGLVIEALIVGMLVVLNLSNHRARAYAKEVTQALRIEKEKLSKKNAELEQFVYVASHDVKTPVRGIGGLTEMIQEDLADYLKASDANPDVERNLKRILDRVHRVSTLTDDIIEFSQLGQMPENSPEIEIDQIENALREDFKLDFSSLHFKSDIDRVTYDGRGLSRVLDNLVSNAVKYAGRGDDLLIDVTIAEVGDRLDISVSDNGPGIPKAFQAKAFEPFQTLSSDPSPDSSGIGLASVKKCVEAHGFKVNLISEQGQGSRFEFSWPHQSRTSDAPDFQEVA
ncbi:MAG: CHASE domain-containing protein [Pseudomonadota bacterium]